MAGEDGYIKINTKIEGLADALKGIKDLGLGVFGLGAIYKTLTGTVKQLYAALDDLNKAYNVQKQAEVQLAQAVKNNPYLDASTVRRLKDYAGQLQKVSTVGDEQLLPFMAQLAASGRDETQIMQIMSAALDASASGMISLDEAVRGLNLSYTGQIGRLGMQIPALKNLTAEELKQGKAIDVVAKTYKGLAEETARATGSTEQLKNAWGDLKEEMGKDVERTLGPWRRFLTQVIEAKTASEKARNVLLDARKIMAKDTGSLTADEMLTLQQRRNQIIKDLDDKYKQGLERKLLEMELVDLNKKISAVMEIRDIEKETILAEEAAADRAAKEAEDVRVAAQTREEYLAKNTEEREKALETMRLEAQLRGEQLDDEAVLDEYVRSYISLLTEAPGLVNANDAEAQQLLGTIRAQVDAIKAKQAAEHDAATLAQLEAANQAAAETALNRFIATLNGISSPDNRTPQEKLADQRRSLEQFYDEIMSMETISEEEKLALEEQYTEKRIALIQMEKEAELQAAEEIKQARKDMAMEALDSLVNTVNTMGNLAKENSKANLDVKIAEIEAEELSEEEKNKKILEAQKKAAREQYRIELWQWTVSSLQAAANIAEGMSKCFAENGPYGFITAALVAAAGAAQIATIIASKPQPPAFATGGVVPGNSYSGDRINALVNSGEMILTRQQQARLFDMANGIGGGGETNINIKNFRANDVDVSASVTGKDIEIIIDRRVKDSLARGRYDRELLMQQNAQNGTRITN